VSLRPAAVAAAALLLGCASQGRSLPPIPGSRITLDQAIFLPGRDSRFALSRGGLWRLCRASDHARGSRLGLITIILAREGLLQLGEAGDCEVRVTRSDREAPRPSDFVHDAHGCRMVFAQDGGMLRSARLAPTPFVPEQYEKCLLRLGLFLVGYNGALAIGDEDLFVRSRHSPWMSFPRPPAFVPIFQWTIGACDVDPARIARRADLPTNMHCREI
jgi:hypothetical protein